MRSEKHITQSIVTESPTGPEGWTFVDDEGAFVLPHPQRTSYLYFPLANEAGMMSAITAELQGDAKVGQNAFLLAPATVEDLQHARYGRNFWINIDGRCPWSVAGASARQRAEKLDHELADEVTLEAGILWHRVTRRNRALGVQAEVTSFVPARGGHEELMEVVIRNISTEDLRITPTAAIPLFARSADNVRDHRHVTSLLHRIHTTRTGVVVQPTLSFDERGHTPNCLSYAVQGLDDAGEPPVGFFPVVEDFVGEGGSLDWPAAVVQNRPADVSTGANFDGYEALGGLRFATITLPPGASASYRLALSVRPDQAHDALLPQLSADGFADALEQTRAYWKNKLDAVRIHTGNELFDRWFRWVSVQPILRRIYGCSFLPYHDYGRGGRGWRDLWQDCLALLLMEQQDVRGLLLNNFAGVRFDGSNATIIGNAPGEFVADRNNISRVWMDHGAWPLLATRLYIDQSGDLDFLLEEQGYFKDMHVERCGAHDRHWHAEQGAILRTNRGGPYRGTVLEHLLIQHLTAFFNVGPHNNIRIEGADWNDGLDMAADQGESVAFSSLYGMQLVTLSALVSELAAERGVKSLKLAAECRLLLDTLSKPVDYAAPKQKQARLRQFLDTCVHTISGERIDVDPAELAADLRKKGEWILTHVREQEWVTDDAGHGWFNGYYDNDGAQLEGKRDGRIRMTLPGQVFSVLSGAATDEQVDDVIRSVDHHLWDERVGGCRLNTDFGDVLMNMGRCYGYAYGHKENGAMFCHMAVMYAYALYARGRAAAGHRVLDAICRRSMDFPTARIYPGIPEYINPRGRGMYSYLTGSASWYLLTLVTQAFGVCGRRGDLHLRPGLVAAQFNADHEAVIELTFADRRLRVVYHNPEGMSAGAYAIAAVRIAGAAEHYRVQGDTAVVPRSTLAALDPQAVHEVRVELR